MSEQEIPSYRLRHLVEALGDRYDFIAALGRGAFAAVYLVRNRRLERQEAIKVMSESYDSDNEFARRFAEESKLVASLDHPNIVKVYDHGDIDGILWYSMQYIDGPTLRSELTSRRRFDPLEAARLVIPMLDALDYSHQQGTIHRDIKPSNVLLSSRGQPFLMDFGIAKSVRGTAHTMTGSVLGTPAYIAPEQAQSLSLDGRVDVYALGTTLYELITGKPPFTGSDMIQVLMRRLNEDPAPLSDLRPDIDPQLESIVRQSLARNRDDRYDAAGMRQALIDWAGSEASPQRLKITAPTSKPQQLDGSGELVVDPSEAITRRVDAPSVEPPGSTGSSLNIEGKRGKVGLWAIGLLLIAAASLAVFSWTRPGSAPPSELADAALPEAPLADGPSVGEELQGERSEDSGEATDAADSPPEKSSPQDSNVGVDSDTASQSQSAATPGSAAPSDSPRTSGANLGDQPKPAPPQTVRASPPPPPVATSRPPEPILRRPVRPPRLLSTPTPQVSSDLVATCAGRAVIVSLRVAEDGTVQSSKILRSDEPACSAAARAAAELSKFEPALDLEQQPIAASTTIHIRFAEEQP